MVTDRVVARCEVADGDRAGLSEHVFDWFAVTIGGAEHADSSPAVLDGIDRIAGPTPDPGTDASIDRFLAGVAAGYDVACTVGEAVGPDSHYDRGFHVTATCGTFGAVATAGVVRETSAAVGRSGGAEVTAQS
ncbi:MmgE/PrpD family protein [Halorubrum yunnanense]|uniref:MmgE/PrpD family protein n=1 Tax=Halorubrum yunnanense TaxID=1526162 RepID=A0ABD5YC54_9EURY|nr:MmgE/PrpD family protein [Halorubrum yunnanense]